MSPVAAGRRGDFNWRMETGDPMGEVNARTRPPL